MWNDLLWPLVGCLSVVSFYICFEAFWKAFSSKDDGVSIFHGLLALVIGFLCLALLLFSKPQTGRGSETTMDWQGIALGVFFLVFALRLLASHQLATELKRHAPSTWELLGRPRYGESSAKELPAFDWGMWARNSEVRRVRFLAHSKLACSAAMWIIALAIITFGDLSKYNFVLSAQRHDERSEAVHAGKN